MLTKQQIRNTPEISNEFMRTDFAKRVKYLEDENKILFDSVRNLIERVEFLEGYLGEALNK